MHAFYFLRSNRRRYVLSTILFSIGVTACEKPKDPPQPHNSMPSISVSTFGVEAPLVEPSTHGLVDPTKGGSANIVAIPGDTLDGGTNASEASKTKGPLLGASHFMTHIWSEPNYRSTRIGYLRAGAKVPIAGASESEPVSRIRTSGCREGWVAIEPRGYVCLEKGGGALNLEQPNVRLATAPPNFNDLLPYKYGFVFRNGAPLYRKVPSPHDWLEKEPWLRPAVKKVVKNDDDESVEEERETKKKPRKKNTSEESHSTEKKAEEKEVWKDTEAEPKAENEASDAGPWWERKDGKDKIRLKDTIESEGIVARRLAKGFAVAIDRTFSWNGRTWHRTTSGLIAPGDAISVTKAPEFKGVALGSEWQLPIGWSHVREAGIFESQDKKHFTLKERLKRQNPIRLLSSKAPEYAEIKSGSSLYIPTVDGRYVRAQDIVRVDAAPLPAEVKPGEKWIDISIKAQSLVAYEGDKPVFATLISSGRDGTNTKGRFATVQGSFRIREKHVAATMDGDTSGEIYSIDDVPYIQYFHASYAVHGAFWHNDFGRVRSHGCVNMSPTDSKWLFFWTEPRLPDGWHAIWADEHNKGTLVVTRP